MSEDQSGGNRRISTDRETIRGWADEHEAVPARHTGAEETRYHVVRETELGSDHERLEWDEFFAEIDDTNHVVVYEETAESEPFDVLARDEALVESDMEREEIERALTEGEVVTSEVTETTVVESVIVEEATIESELVDTELVEERLIDTELIERECTGCEIVADREGEDGALFDEERYFDAVQTGERSDHEGMGVFGADGGKDLPYYAELDVRETWGATRELLERFTVESEIVDTDVAESDRIEDVDIDVEGVQRDILRSDLFDEDADEEIVAQYDIESEFGEGDAIHTFFNRRRTVEDEVVDEKRLRADVTGGEILGMERMETIDIDSEFTDDEGLAPLETRDAEGSAAEPALDDESTAAGGSAADPESTAAGGSAAETGSNAEGEMAGTPTLTEDDVGKQVVDATGEKVGMVATVDAGENVMYVDADPSITERIKAALDWGEVGEEDYPVDADHVSRIDDNEVELKPEEHLSGEESAH